MKQLLLLSLVAVAAIALFGVAGCSGSGGSVVQTQGVGLGAEGMGASGT
jgi:hypothetical protein